MKPAPSWIAFAPALFVVLWATGFVVARLSAGHVEPLTFLSIRFPIAGALFVAIALYQRAAWPDRIHAFHAAVAGALLHGGYLGPIYWAVALLGLLALRLVKRPARRMQTLPLSQEGSAR